MSSVITQHPAADSLDLRKEFASLLENCGVFELNDRAKMSIAGNDRVRWLNGMITNKVRDLAIGQGIYAFVLNVQGHILGDLYAYNRGESLLIETDESQLEKLFGIFRKHIIMDKVELADLRDKSSAIGIAGPKARETMARAGFDVQELAPLEFVDVSWQNFAVTVVRSDNAAVESYEIWSAPEHASRISDALARAGATVISAAALEMLRIASGIPRYGQDIRERDLPQETEQMRALHFTKGCYVGQEIVERIRSRGNVHRKFTGFEVQGTLPAPGSKIQSDGKDVGEITSATSLPVASGTRSVALGYIRREAAAQPLRAGEAQLAVAGLPFTGIFPE